MIILKKQELDLDFYKKVIKVLKVLMKVLYKPNVEGKENLIYESGFVLAGNHKSLLDIPLLATSVEPNVRFMGKKELFDNNICNYIFSKLGAFPVNRDGVDITAIKTAMEILRNEEVLGIFPEGTRNKTDEILLPFKEGTTRIAMKTKKPIIPFGISGEYKLGGGITIRFGEAIDFNKIKVENENEYLRDKVMELIK